MSDIKKVVLAYSGGLDTSIIIPWLKENYDNCEIIAVAGNVGQADELEGLEEKALKTGASKLIIADLVDEMVDDIIIPALKMDAKYETYLLGTAFARPVIGKKLAEIALAEGADAIEKFEVTEFTEKTVTIFSPLRSGDNVVPAGEDVSKGQLVLKKGIVLTAADCGILAALGVTDVLVYERVRISVISTGDELVQIEDALAPGKIRNSSAYTMEAFLTDWGHTVTRYGIVKDDVTAIAMAVKDVVATSDVVLTTGGVSVGDYDCLQDAMQQLDAKVLFWKLKMKPGSAFLASVYEGTPVISLSGNPGAAMIAMMLVAQPVLRKMAGRADVSLETIEVTLKDGFRKKSKMRRFLPGRLRIVDGQAVLDLTPTQGNGMLSPLHGCNLIGEIPMDSPAMEAGSRIRAYVMDSI